MNYKCLCQGRLCRSVVQQITWHGVKRLQYQVEGTQRKQELTSIEFWAAQLPSSNTKN